ncbi:MAG: hypothetical protein ACHQNA_02140 [Acidimicrobiales bacterium]
MPRTYRTVLQVALHTAANPLDPVGATDWSETRASEFVEVDVEMTDQLVTRAGNLQLVATRPVEAAGVWALFVDRWQKAKPLYWQAVGGELAAGEIFELAAGSERLSLGDSFAVRNVAATCRRARCS